jgi:hypothetical protein
MKMIMKMLLSIAITLVIGSHATFGQKVDDQRMGRDIEVAENVLSTLIKQQFEQQRMFFPLEIKGFYQPGYGVTFRLPADYTTPIALTIRGGADRAVVWESGSGGNRTFSVGTTQSEEDEMPAVAPTPGSTSKSMSLKDNAREKEKTRRRLDMDSVKNSYNLKIIEASKNFIVDYGDLISQLAPNERIVVTNQGDRPRMWVNQYFDSPKRTHLSIEGLRSDITNFKQGKLSREQAIKNVKVVNTESVDKVEPDMELLTSIFNRLYRPDLSNTYFTEENIYYERLSNFGAIFYMQVYSSTPHDNGRYSLPTFKLEDVDQATRDKKVKEAYPQFEKELKENILEYGRTLKSLTDEENLVFNVILTKCVKCGIPASIELSVKSGVLKELSAGKLDNATALSKVTIKKNGSQ